MKVTQVRNLSRATMIGDQVRVADTSISRMVGLLGRRGLEPGEGLWIRPSSGVHTVGMRFPIDVIGLDGELRIVRLWRELVPYRVTSVSLKLKSVIELPAGQIAASGSEIGDVVTIFGVAG